MDKLNSLSPLSILNRGYSIMIDKDSGIIRKYNQVKTGGLYDVILQEGQIEVKVTNIKNKNEFL